MRDRRPSPCFPCSLFLHRCTLLQSVTAADIDLSRDVSQLRQAWEASVKSGVASRRNVTENGIREVANSAVAMLAPAESLARRLAAGEGVPSGEDDGRFVFAGKDLLPGESLSEYGIGRDSTIHMLGRLRGGAQLGKVVKGRSQVSVIRCSS